MPASATAKRQTSIPAATPQTKPTALMDIAKPTQDLLETFGWGYNEPGLLLDERKEIWQCLQLVDHVDPTAGGETPIPKKFWDCVVMPARVLPAFKSPNDAKALAIASCQTLEQLIEWRNIVEDGDAEALEAAFLEFLERSSAGTTTAAGDVFTDPSTRAVWFGRKAGRAPALSNDRAMMAVETLFNIVMKEESCRVCGCTENDCQQCIEATGQPCHWVEADLCSRCAAEQDAAISAEMNGSGVAGAGLSEAKEAPGFRADALQPRPPKGKKPKASSKTPAPGPTSEKPTPAAGELKTLPLRDILPSPANHRKEFDKEALKELAESIKQHGILQPLLVQLMTRELRDELPASLNYPESYLLIAGERRYRAAKLAGLTEVPVMVQQFGQLQSSLAMLEENIRRVDLNPIERAQAIQRLVTEHKLSQKEVGNMIGCTQGQVSNELRLLNLPAGLQELVASGVVAPTLVRVLLPVADIPAVMEDLLKHITEQHKAGRPIEATSLDHRMTDSIRNHSRSMKFDANWQAYCAPNPKARHFKTISKEDEAALEIREFKCLSQWEGQQRTFNLKKFGELNAKPLAARREKHNAYKEKNRSHSGAAKPKESEPLFQSEYYLENAIEEQLSEMLADSLEACRDKTASRTVCLALLIMCDGGIDEAFLNRARQPWNPSSESLVPDLIAKLSVSDAELLKLLRSTMAKELRGDIHLQPRESIELAKALGVDLVATWTPSEEVLEQLTDAGRQQLEASAGTIPGFLRPFFGLPEEKPKKAAKKKAKAA